MSPLGLVCPRCKQRLYANLPSGPCRSFWEIQPAAYSLDGKPCFVYTPWWDDYRIRSLHPPDSQTARIRAANKQQQAVSAEFDWHNNIRLERGLMNDSEFDAEQ